MRDECVIRVRDLRKKNKDKLLIDNVNMTLKRGEVYGLIGDDRAGKRMLINIIMGLVKQNSGIVQLFGADGKKELKKNRKRIGVLIGERAYYPNMTVYENLAACRIQKGIPGRTCIENSLKLVKLEEVRHKKVEELSITMKKKLGIAMAMIGEPEILILDEPMSGLDPLGIIEVRELLRKLNEEKNITLLISSHMLLELNKFATYYGIIHKGKLLEEISSKALDEKCRKTLNIKVDDVNKATAVLEKELDIRDFKVLPDGTIKLYEYVNNPRKVSILLAKSDIIIDEFIVKGDGLERYFINLIGVNSANV